MAWLFPWFRPPAASPVQEPRLPPFRYPNYFNQVVEMRGPNNTGGTQIVYTVQSGYEFWLTQINADCFSVGATYISGAILREDGVTVAQNLFVRAVPAASVRSVELNFPWPIYVPENFSISKTLTVIPAQASVGATGWVGPVPGSRTIQTRY